MKLRRLAPTPVGRFFLVGCVFLAISRPALATTPIDPDELSGRIDSFVAQFDAANQLSGVLLVAQGDSIMFLRAYGLAHRGLDVPNTTDTRIGIASITKTMTQVVLSQLLSEGVLTQDTPIANWLPDFPRGDEITIDHLARHRAGIPHRVTTPAEESLPLTAQDVVDQASRLPLVFESDSASSYSSAGYTILVRCLELATGKTYAQLLQERIFEPAGMHDTVEPRPGREIKRMASNYLPGRNEVWPAPLKGLTFLAGAGSVVSTAEDLWRFVQTLRTDALLITFDMLAREGRVNWTGASNGCYAYIDTHPEQQLTCIWLGNSWCAAADAVRQELPALIAGEPTTPRPRPQLTGPLPVADLAAYEGDYESRPGAWYTVRILAGELWIADSMALGIGPDRFWHQPWHCEVAFVRNEAGTVVAMERRDGSGNTSWPRRNTRAQ